MKKHYKKLLISILSVSLIFSNYINIYASGGGHFHSAQEAFDFWRLNMAACLSNIGGIVFGDSEGAYNSWRDFLQRQHTFDTEEQEYEWLYDNIEVDNPEHPNEYTILNSLKNDINLFISEYTKELDQEQAYVYRNTFKPSSLKGSLFETPNAYNRALSNLNTYCGRYDYVFATKVNSNNEEYLISLCESVSDCGFIQSGYPYQSQGTDWYYYQWGLPTMNSPIKTIIDNLTTGAHSEYDKPQDAVNGETANLGIYNRFIYETFFYCDTSRQVNLSSYSTLFTKMGGKIKSYKTLEDIKEADTNTVTYPYYKVTPTCSGNTITQSQIDNSVTYGDVNNQVITYIINNGGITEEQLQRLIEAILAGRTNPDPNDPKPNDPDPNYPVPDDPTPAPSIDFSGLLKGLMSLIASIVGLLSSLIGYVAELLAQLISSINGIIDNLKSLITTGIMGIFSAVFPFIPPEISSILTLGFLLCTVIAVIKFIRG